MKRRVVITDVSIKTNDIENFDDLCQKLNAKHPFTLTHKNGDQKGNQFQSGENKVGKFTTPGHLEAVALETLKDLQDKDVINTLYDDILFSIGTSGLGIHSLEDYVVNKIPLYSQKLIKDFFVAVKEVLPQMSEVCLSNTACTASTNAIGIAYKSIMNGEYECAVCGGFDDVIDLNYSGFMSLTALSEDVCRPFRTDRNGINLADGAAFVILEEREAALQRNATIYGEVLGFASSNDCYSNTAPEPTGEIALRNMIAVCQNLDNFAQKIEYVSAHGTGTNLNDQMEINLLHKFAAHCAPSRQQNLKFSSIKNLVGHTLAASGIVETLFTIASLQTDFALQECDPSVQLWDESLLTYYTKRSETDDMYFIKNSFAFGGSVASLLVKGVAK